MIAPAEQSQSQRVAEGVAARVERPQRAPRAATVTILAALFVADMLALAFIDRSTAAALALALVAAALFIGLVASAGAFDRASWDPAPDEQDAYDRTCREMDEIDRRLDLRAGSISRLDRHDGVGTHTPRNAQTHP